MRAATCAMPLCRLLVPARTARTRQAQPTPTALINSCRSGGRRTPMSESPDDPNVQWVPPSASCGDEEPERNAGEPVQDGWAEIVRQSTDDFLAIEQKRAGLAEREARYDGGDDDGGLDSRAVPGQSA